MTIGDFAALTHLTIRTLRHYHETGVLEPAEVDPVTGYRYYTPDQIPTAQVVHRLRELDVPLPQVKAIMATEDPARRAALITDHLARLEAELDRTRAAVRALQRLLRPESSELTVQITSLPARTVAVTEATVASADVLRWYDRALADLDEAVPAAFRRGPLTGQFANALFAEGEGAARLFYPVGSTTEPSLTRRVSLRELPPVELACVVHPGDHDTIGETYGQLGRWVGENALTVGDHVQETYLVGPRDTPDEEAWRTEIGWPILRLSTGTRPAR